MAHTWHILVLVTEEGLDPDTALTGVLDADTEFVVEAAGIVGVRRIRLLQTLRLQLVSLEPYPDAADFFLAGGSSPSGGFFWTSHGAYLQGSYLQST